MSDQINQHEFDFKLPMYPNQKDVECELTMDGRKLEGVTSLYLKAGNNGFTNVAIEFEASCAVQFAGHLVANVTKTDNLDADLLLSTICQEAMQWVQKSHNLESWEIFTSFESKADFVRRIIELAIERIK